MALFTPRLSTKQMARLSFHLWSLARGGTSLRRAFELLDDRAFALPIRRLGRDVAHHIAQGNTLAQALERVRDRLPVMAYNLMVVGEESGRLDRTLEHLHYHYERRVAIQRQAFQIALYPILIYISAIMIAFVKGAVLTNEDLEVYVWNYVKALSWYYGTRLAVLLMTMRILDQWGYLTPIIDTITARAPFIRSVFVPLALARFFRCLRLMLDTGCHVVTALEVAIRGTSNAVLERQLRRTIPAVKEGRPVLESMASTGALPALVREMLVTGEFAGKSEENLEAAADFLEAEATTAIRLIGAGIGIVIVAGFVWSMLQYAILVLAAIYRAYTNSVLGPLSGRG